MLPSEDKGLQYAIKIICFYIEGIKVVDCLGPSYYWNVAS